MPELPEIWNLAQQMNETLSGKTIATVDVRQEKCLNLPLDLFQQGLENRTLGTTTAKGKWIFTKVSPDQNLLLNLGMGGLVLYLDLEQAKNAPRYRLKFVFSDHSALAIDFSWFGYVHLVGSLAEHAMTASLGPSPLEEDFTWDCFRQILAGRKGILKSVLLDQHAISGIGNVYVQDILFRARLHPLRKIPSLDEGEQRRLVSGHSAGVAERSRSRRADLRTRPFQPSGSFPAVSSGIPRRKTMPRVRIHHRQDPHQQYFLLHLPRLPNLNEDAPSDKSFGRLRHDSLERHPAVVFQQGLAGLIQNPMGECACDRVGFLNEPTPMGKDHDLQSNLVSLELDLWLNRQRACFLY